jgi:hypothetical protein
MTLVTTHVTRPVERNERNELAAEQAAALDRTNPTSSAMREDTSGSPGGTTTP